MLSVLTLNINYLVDKHGPWDTRKHLVVAAIQKANPDIIALQAVARPSGPAQSQHQADQLAGLLNDYHYSFFQPAEESEDGSAKGSAVLSRLPIAEQDSLALSLREGLLDKDRRRVLYTCFDLPGGPLHLFNAHFSWVGEQASDNLDEAIPYIQSKGGPSLLVGDFNIPAGEPLLERFVEAGWTDAWTRLNPSQKGLTFEADSPTIRIDYAWLDPLLASKLSAVEIVENEAPDGQTRMSDHLGLVVRLSL